MDHHSALSVIYTEDVAEALRCCDRTARRLMKESGCAFKIGRRWAISTETFLQILQGTQPHQTGVQP